MGELKYFGKFKIDKSMVGHSCCWSSAIVRNCVETDLKGDSTEFVDLICECDEDWAQYICDQLNRGIKKDDE